MQSSCAVKGRCCLFIGCTGRRRLAAHNERRHPAELAHSCGSMPHWGIDCCATPQRRPLRNQRVRERRGEQCSPVQFSGCARFLRASNARPYGPAQSLPCVKGGAPQGRRDCSLAGVSRCMGKVTIPQSALSRSQLPLHKGAFTLPPIEFIWPRRGQTEKKSY